MPDQVSVQVGGVAVSTGSPFPVTGTITSTPSGTQNVSVTNTPTVNSTEIPTATVANGITPVVSASAAVSSLVLKASAGNMYSVYATNSTATAGYLILLNATTAPADGAVVPVEFVQLPASGTASISYSTYPTAFSTGITAVVSSGANPYTKTTGVITASIQGRVK